MRSEAEIENVLKRCQQAIGYEFRDQRLLQCCLTHASAAVVRTDSNERLEFLGDAVLDLVICEELFRRMPDLPEGQLTQLKSRIVSRSICAIIADTLQLGEMILLGSGLNSAPASVRAAVIEALIAGIYLDGGLEAVREFVIRVFHKELSETEVSELENYKSQLQEYSQQRGGPSPTYAVVEYRGPDHDREFLVRVFIGDSSFEPAWGRSKKQAEQRAARIALNSVRDQGTTIVEPPASARREEVDPGSV